MREAVLRQPVGGALVMADQLLRLAALTELPGVRVWLVPDVTGAFAGMTSFTLLSFREYEFEDVVWSMNVTLMALTTARYRA